MATKKRAAKESHEVERPVLIDEKDGVCDLCAKHSDGKCDVCGGSLTTKDPNMGMSGYQSVLPTHFHLEMVGGEGGKTPGRNGKYAELCYKCHRTDRKRVYGSDYGESG